MEKIINIGGKECKLKTNAALVRVYRLYVGRELFEDMHKLMATAYAINQAVNGKTDPPPKADQLEMMTILEDVVFAMNKHGDKSQPDTVEEWLEQFEDESALSVPEVFAQVVDIWNHEQGTTSEERKKKDRSTDG